MMYPLTMMAYSSSTHESKLRSSCPLAFVVLLLVVDLQIANGLSSLRCRPRWSIDAATQQRCPSCLAMNKGTSGNKESSGDTSRYEDSSVASKGIVSTLTNLVNSLSSRQRKDVPAETAAATNDAPPITSSPQSPQELMERIRQDYTVKNYLWTGDIDLTAFDRNCEFTDPTLSFTGTEQFVKNIQNLRPIVDILIPKREDGTKACASVLLDLKLDEEKGYIQSRWNMVGDLTGLPWKPRIDVIGRTKFWFREQQATTSASSSSDERVYQVVEYDEEWEIPAGKALLQLVTPAGTIPNYSSTASKELNN